MAPGEKIIMKYKKLKMLNEILLNRLIQILECYQKTYNVRVHIF
jgi:hypothetical protein